MSKLAIVRENFFGSEMEDRSVPKLSQFFVVYSCAFIVKFQYKKWPPSFRWKEVTLALDETLPMQDCVHSCTHVCLYTQVMRSVFTWVPMFAYIYPGDEVCVHLGTHVCLYTQVMRSVFTWVPMFAYIYPGDEVCVHLGTHVCLYIPR